MQKNTRFIALQIIVAAVGCLIFSACGKQLPYKVVHIEGTITYAGKPLANSDLEFTPVDGKGRPSIAHSDEEGNFIAMYSNDVKGVQAGPCILYVNCSGELVGPGQIKFTKEQQGLIALYGPGSKGFELTIPDKNDKDFQINLP